MKRVNVVGLGYIGLPTATVLALAGFRVYGIDVEASVVNTVNAGRVHLEEPGLDKVVSMMVNAGKLSAHLAPEKAEVHVVAVPTPLGCNDSADLSYVGVATEALLPVIKAGDLVIVESTISPGTTRNLVAPILQKTGLELGRNLFLAHCPERVLPGRILTELVENNRIIGGYDPLSAEKAADIYRTFVKGVIITTDATTAELAKLVENTYRDLNIAFANELVKIARSLGVNANEVIELANKHPRVNILQPGPGVGGHCLAVDPYFIVEKAPHESRLITTAREINRSMPHHVVEDVRTLLGSLTGKKFAVMGLTYKANVDDTREAPSAEIIHLLEKEGAVVRCHDPHVKTYSRQLFSLTDAVRGSDCVLFLVDHQEFKSIKWGSLVELSPMGLVYDAKNAISDTRARLHKLGDYTRQAVHTRLAVGNESQIGW